MQLKIIEDGIQILAEDGAFRFIHGFLWFVWSRSLRRLMPIKDEHAPVLIDDVKFLNHGSFPLRLGDRFIGWERPKFPRDSYNQNGETNAHQRLTDEGDHVCIIGGGQGVTTVHAAREVGKKGSVTVFEGGQIASHVCQMVKLNDVDDVVTVKKAIVGDPNILYQGMADDVEVLDPADLPACDVLEMDCEGSELGILEGMQIRPRVLIVELHPTRYDAPDAAIYVYELIEEMGYEVVYWSTQAGEQMSEAEFREIITDGSGDVLAAVRA